MGTASKENDKRFFEVRDFHDGSRGSIYRLVLDEYSTMFESFQAAEAVNAWEDRQNKWVVVGENFPKFFGGDSSKVGQLRAALQCCRYVVESFERRSWALNSIENYKRQLQRAADAAADAAAAAAAKSDGAVVNA
jgi:hypothetical protein